MSKKIISSFNISDSDDADTTKTSFEEILSSIEAQEIPSRYIDEVIIHYQDGSSDIVDTDQLPTILSVGKELLKNQIDNETGRTMKNIQVMLNIALLECEINIEVEKLLGKLC